MRSIPRRFPDYNSKVPDVNEDCSDASNASRRALARTILIDFYDNVYDDGTGNYVEVDFNSTPVFNARPT